MPRAGRRGWKELGKHTYADVSGPSGSYAPCPRTCRARPSVPKACGGLLSCGAERGLAPEAPVRVQLAARPSLSLKDVGEAAKADARKSLEESHGMCFRK
jgi:hypothetical protein